MNNSKILDKKVKEYIERYRNLKILDKKVVCPYAINYVEQEFLSMMKLSKIDEEKIRNVHELYKSNKSTYGWYRGKGTPEQLEKSFIKISKARGFNINNSTSEGIRESMKLFGLGIDCSGYIYNILFYGFKSINMEEEFKQSLEWSDINKMKVSRASVDIFSGKASTIITDLNSLSNLDLILMKNNTSEYIHMAMVLKVGNKLNITQSAFSILPNGVRIDGFKVENNSPIFEFKVDIGTDWNILYKNNQLEFRRLNVI